MIFIWTKIGGAMFFSLQFFKMLIFYLPYIVGLPRMPFPYNHKFEVKHILE
jgi:hypothetical protein